MRGCNKKKKAKYIVIVFFAIIILGRLLCDNRTKSERPWKARHSGLVPSFFDRKQRTFTIIKQAGVCRCTLPAEGGYSGCYQSLLEGGSASNRACVLPRVISQADLYAWRRMWLLPYVDLRRLAIWHPEDVPLARSQRLRYLRLSRHLRIELNHRRSYRRTCLLHRAAARCHSYHPSNHLNYIVNEEGLFLLQFGVRSKPSFFVAQKPEYLLAMRRRKGVFKHETHDSRWSASTGIADADHTRLWAFWQRRGWHSPWVPKLPLSPSSLEISVLRVCRVSLLLQSRFYTQKSKWHIWCRKGNLSWITKSKSSRMNSSVRWGRSSTEKHFCSAAQMLQEHWDMPDPARQLLTIARVS